MEDWLRFKCAGHDDEEGIRGKKEEENGRLETTFPS